MVNAVLPIARNSLQPTFRHIRFLFHLVVVQQIGGPKRRTVDLKLAAQGVQRHQVEAEVFAYRHGKTDGKRDLLPVKSARVDLLQGGRGGLVECAELEIGPGG